MVGVYFSVKLAVVNNGGVFFVVVELTCDQVKTLRFTSVLERKRSLTER